MSSQAEGEKQEVGLTPDEVREVNRLKHKEDITRTHLVKKATNVFAASLTALYLTSPL